MDTSIFMEKSVKPDELLLKNALLESYTYWEKIEIYVLEKYPTATKEWNYSGAKYGWSYRIKDKKRAIIYLLPRENFFKVAFVFGQKAFDEIMKSDVSTFIKADLEQAKVYAEGRGIRIDIREKLVLKDVFQLVDIKLAN